MQYFLDSKNDAILDTQTDSSAIDTRTIRMGKMNLVKAYPEFSTALFAYSTCEISLPLITDPRT
jgi:hypothetical protein